MGDTKDFCRQAINYIEIMSMTKVHPNDADLGKAVREFVMEQKLSKDK